MPDQPGAYRPIFEVLPDTEEWLVLSPDARLTLVVLKLTLGRYGIETVNVHQLAAQTGLGPDQVRAALAELTAHGPTGEPWCYVHPIGPISWLVWLRNGLRFDPWWQPGNPHHQVGLERFARSLPAVPMVNAFMKKYGKRGAVAHPDLPASVPPPISTPNGPKGVTTPKRGNYPHHSKPSDDSTYAQGVPTLGGDQQETRDRKQDLEFGSIPHDLLSPEAVARASADQSVGLRSRMQIQNLDPDDHRSPAILREIASLRPDRPGWIEQTLQAFPNREAGLEFLYHLARSFEESTLEELPREARIRTLQARVLKATS